MGNGLGCCQSLLGLDVETKRIRLSPGELCVPRPDQEPIKSESLGLGPRYLHVFVKAAWAIPSTMTTSRLENQNSTLQRSVRLSEFHEAYATRIPATYEEHRQE